MAESISGQIIKLHTSSRQQLLEMWQKLYQRAAPTGIRRELLVPFLAYRIQEQAYGGLKPSTRSELRRVAQDLEKPTGSNERRTRIRIKPGSRLVREWRGETHEVAITETGFEYRGSSYPSLSKIACKITGTRWSGPAFFGLVKGNSNSGHRDE
jgi:Protein of unknown function (DUF2924)